MPARRSRTERWLSSLEQIASRGGALEIAQAPRDVEPRSGADVIWRVRLLQVRDDDLIIEYPGAAGSSFTLPVGSELVAVMSVGQNRWMFHTTVLGETSMPLRTGTVLACRLTMPDRVERCQRRNTFRISTAELSPPPVDIWPILEPMSVIAAEVANRASIAEAAAAASLGSPPLSLARPILPDVGPGFRSTLVNISAGGIGIVTDHENTSLLNSSSLFWLMVDLRPRIAAPLGVTARLAHMRLDSSQRVGCGLSYEFQYHPAHRPFVVDQITKLVGEVQRRIALEAA